MEFNIANLLMLECNSDSPFIAKNHYPILAGTNVDGGNEYVAVVMRRNGGDNKEELRSVQLQTDRTPRRSW